MALRLKDIAGEVCKILLPIRYEVFYGKGKEIAVCTLASMDLLLTISRSDLMDRIALVARLFSENKGIDKIIEYSYKNPELKYIILSGKDAKGHLAGDALLALKKYGIDSNRRIINAKGKEPILTVDKDIIDEFRDRVEIINLIGVTDIIKIKDIINTL